jgi:hypothetical protein
MPGPGGVGCGDSGEDVLLHLADLTAADEVVLAALRERRPPFDRFLMQTEFFAQLAEHRRRRGAPRPPMSRRRIRDLTAED